MKLVIILFVLSFTCLASITKTYVVPDMVCDHCAKTITKELMKIRGLSKNNIQFDIIKKQVKIIFEDNISLSKSELKTIQYEAGYDLIIK